MLEGDREDLFLVPFEAVRSAIFSESAPSHGKWGWEETDRRSDLSVWYRPAPVESSTVAEALSEPSARRTWSCRHPTTSARSVDEAWSRTIVSTMSSLAAPTLPLSTHSSNHD